MPKEAQQNYLQIMSKYKDKNLKASKCFSPGCEW